ncbi:hypothetical protein CC78DRAFT_569769 [Lojkania enalia]|uniref:lytic cellulose monooxygenase (C4-dehydrogenating) n=1 Tax=Lojkania enalia TaxID=147567 RepID=A0A9P4K9G4_9PLEO|nr:hypothetical protein CC78DRAFT_569769 [Didymosphaeria enalia]
MKAILFLGQVGALISSVHAHYYFSIFVVNKTETPEWKYIRDVAIEEGFGPYTWQKGRPQYDLDSPDFVCGRSAFLAANKTETADVVAGDIVGFHLTHEFDDSGNYDIFHQGYASAFLARAPNDDITSFSGVGYDKWFKIDFVGASMDAIPPGGWITYQKTSINFTIPERVPPGKYLLRLEHIMNRRNNEINEPECYIQCAQVNIMGQGGGVFINEDFTKFPGAYSIDDEKFTKLSTLEPMEYNKEQGPGPAVWTG